MNIQKPLRIVTEKGSLLTGLLDLIHGLLHLVGHDHEDDAEASLMVAEERRLWRELNP